MAPLIQSRRLDLVPLTPDMLRMLLAGECSGAAHLLGVAEAGMSDIPQDVMQLRLEQLESDPDLQPWLLRAIILRERHVCVGHIGFHTAPGAEYLAELSPGGVELGYEVSESWRRQGIVSEAIQAMMRWAGEFHEVRSFIVSISPDNLPSLRLAEKLGFQKIGSHIDEIDGLEHIYQRSYLPVETALQPP